MKKIRLLALLPLLALCSCNQGSNEKETLAKEIEYVNGCIITKAQRDYPLYKKYALNTYLVDTTEYLHIFSSNYYCYSQDYQYFHIEYLVSLRDYIIDIKEIANEYIERANNYSSIN